MQSSATNGPRTATGCSTRCSDNGDFRDAARHARGAVWIHGNGIYFLRGEDARGAGMLAEARADYAHAAALFKAHAGDRDDLALDGILRLAVGFLAIGDDASARSLWRTYLKYTDPSERNKEAVAAALLERHDGRGFFASLYDYPGTQSFHEGVSAGRSGAFEIARAKLDARGLRERRAGRRRTRSHFTIRKRVGMGN